MSALDERWYIGIGRVKGQSGVKWPDHQDGIDSVISASLQLRTSGRDLAASLHPDGAG